MLPPNGSRPISSASARQAHFEAPGSDLARPDKPEWCFDRLDGWITDQTDFLAQCGS